MFHLEEERIFEENLFYVFGVGKKYQKKSCTTHPPPSPFCMNATMLGGGWRIDHSANFQLHRLAGSASICLPIFARHRKLQKRINNNNNNNNNNNMIKNINLPISARRRHRASQLTGLHNNINIIINNTKFCLPRQKKWSLQRQYKKDNEGGLSRDCSNYFQTGTYFILFW